jgi:hypothetical protein
LSAACDPEGPAAEDHDLRFFDLWIYQGIYVHGREQEQREASPTAAIIDARA